MSQSQTTSPIHGSCLCGAVTYTLSAPPQMSLLCHCINCKKWTGSAFMMNDWYNRDEFQIQADTPTTIKTFVDKMCDSKNKLSRHFCAHCGTPLYSSSERNPQAVIVPRGTIDGKCGREDAMNPEKVWEGDYITRQTDTGGADHSWKPEREYFCKRKMTWLPKVQGAETLQSMT